MSKLSEEFISCADRILQVIDEAQHPISANFDISLDMNCVPVIRYTIEEQVPEKKEK